LVFIAPLLVASLTLSEANADANFGSDEWPMFHHDSVHTGYSTSKAPETNQTHWTYKINGAAGSPAIANGRVYVGSAEGIIYCLNAIGGTFLWSYQTGGGVEACPTVVENQVYIGSADQNIYCLEAYSAQKHGTILQVARYVHLRLF